jgi:hypothetical protein
MTIDPVQFFSDLLAAVWMFVADFLRQVLAALLF